LLYFQALQFPSCGLCWNSLWSYNYCIQWNVASGWVAYGILKQYHCMSLVYPRSSTLTAPQPRGTTSSNTTWSNATCDDYVG
jgi:hypothetical protein